MPLAVRNIGKIVIGGQISVANVGFEQSEEDRCCFRAVDIALRVHLSVRIADDIGEMVVAVELVRHTGSLPACIDRLVAVHRHACDLLRQRLVGIPAGKGIALADRSLIQRHSRAGGIAFVLIGSAAVRLVVQRILGGAASATAGISTAGGGCFLIQQCKRREGVNCELNEFLSADCNRFTCQFLRNTSGQKFIHISVTVAVDALKVDDMELRV